MQTHSRRDFLTRMLGTCFTGAAVIERALFRAAHARAQAPAHHETLFDIEQTADGVYLAVARPAPVLNCNAVIFVNSRDILVVDAHSKPSAAASLVAQVRREVSEKPVRYVVNTHFHWDHVQGTPAYRSLAHGADLIASRKTRELIATHSAKRVRTSIERMEAGLEDLRTNAAAGGAGKGYYTRMMAATEAYLREIRTYSPELPNITFGDHLVLHDDAHDLHLVFKGRAHTASDVSVFCPQKKVIATADLVTGFIPGMGDGFPQEWPATLARVSALDFGLVMPGHGAVQQGRRRLSQLSGYIEEITESVTQGHAAGRSLADLEESITPATLRSIGESDYAGFLASTIAKYRFLAPGVSGADAMTAAVKRNVGDVYKTLG